jgi:hypothetical protein
MAVAQQSFWFGCLMGAAMECKMSIAGMVDSFSFCTWAAPHLAPNCCGHLLRPKCNRRAKDDIIVPKPELLRWITCFYHLFLQG